MRKFCGAKLNNMQTAKCGLIWIFGQKSSCDSHDFDMSLKTNPIGMAQFILKKWLDFYKIELDLEKNFASNDGLADIKWVLESKLAVTKTLIDLI